MKLARPLSALHFGPMDLTTTLVSGAVLLALAVFAGWRGALPPNLVKGPRMIPWRGIMVFSSAGVMLLLVHLAALFKGGS